LEQGQFVGVEPGIFQEYFLADDLIARLVARLNSTGGLAKQLGDSAYMAWLGLIIAWHLWFTAGFDGANICTIGFIPPCFCIVLCLNC